MLIFRVLHTVPYNNRLPVQDVTASLHAYFTCNLLIGLSILLSYKQFGSNPIECMTPLGFTSAWNQYVENYCFSADTYYVSFNNQIVDFSPEQKKSLHISYYQWMPFFLLFQCACFKFPTFLWKYLAASSGVKVGEVLRLATNESNADPASRAQNIRSLCTHLQGALRFYDRLKQYSSHYIACIYFFTKTAFLLNVFAQTALLNRYLFPHKGVAYGFSVWRNLIDGNTTWRESGIFPRVTLCDFEVREMGQSQNHTIQCVLLLNMFTEKVFVLLWAWYIILAAFTLCNFTSWVMLFANRRFTEHFVFNHLEMSGERIFESFSPSDCSERLTQEIQSHVSRFIRKYLKSDGILILRLIAQHADVVFTTELVYWLWESHTAIEQQRETLRRTKKPWREHLRRVEELRRGASGGRFSPTRLSLPYKPLSYGGVGPLDKACFESRRDSADASGLRTDSMPSILHGVLYKEQRRRGSRTPLQRTRSVEGAQESFKHADSSDDSSSSDEGTGGNASLKRRFSRPSH